MGRWFHSRSPPSCETDVHASPAQVPSPAAHPKPPGSLICKGHPPPIGQCYLCVYPRNTFSPPLISHCSFSDRGAAGHRSGPCVHLRRPSDCTHVDLWLVAGTPRGGPARPRAHIRSPTSICPSELRGSPGPTAPSVGAHHDALLGSRAVSAAGGCQWCLRCKPGPARTAGDAWRPARRGPQNSRNDQTGLAGSQLSL